MAKLSRAQDEALLALPASKVTVEQAARLMIKGYRRSVVAAIRQADDPALYVLQVGLALGVLIDNPKNGYHQLRQLLSAFPVRGVVDSSLTEEVPHEVR